MATKLKTHKLTVSVVGLQFRWTQDGRKVLARSVPFPAELERQPDNPKDPNAVKVNIAGDYKLTKLRGRQLGYLRAGTAAMFAPRLDNGTLEVVKAWVTEVDDTEATLELRLRDIPKKMPGKRALDKPASRK